MWSKTTDNPNKDLWGRQNKEPQNTQWRVRATSSARIFEQLKQTDRMMLSTVFINPIWNIGLASSKCPKWPGHSAMLAVQVSHFIFLSIVPSLGSLKPPGFGFPLSVVSPCSICITDICLCIHQMAIIQSTVKKNTKNHSQCLQCPKISQEKWYRIIKKKNIQKESLNQCSLEASKVQFPPQFFFSSATRQTTKNYGREIRKEITISSGLRMPNWTMRTLATSAGE